MLDFNLKEVPEEQKSSQEKKREASGYESNKSKVDFSFIPDQEEKPAVEVERKEPLFEEEPPKTQPPPFARERFRNDYADEPADFTSRSGKTWLYVLLGIIGVALITVFVYLLMGPGGTKEETPDYTLTPTTDSLPKPQNLVPPYVQTQFAQNQGKNQLYVNYLNSFLNSATSNSNYYLLAITNGNLYLSILGDSRDAIAEYRRALKDQYPGILMNAVSAQDRFVGEQKKLLADFYIPLPAPSASSALTLTARPAGSGEIRAAISSVAQKYGLKTSYFQQGEQVNEGNFRKTYLYAQLNGSKSAMINFIQDISQSYPALQFLKISFYPSNAVTMDGANINARIEAAAYDPA